MMIHVTDARYVDGYTLWLRFNDGLEGEVDLEDELYGEVFAPLKNVEVFRDFSLDPELKTITWKTGADFAPEFLHDRVRVTA